MGSVDMTSPEAKAPPSRWTAEAAFIGNEKSAKVTQKKSKIKPCQPRLDIIFRSYAQIFRKFSEVSTASPSTPDEIRGAAPWLTRMDDADGLSN